MSRKQGTFHNEARKFFWSCTPEEAHALFMNATAFPFGDIRTWRRQLKEARHGGDGTPGGAIAWAHWQVEIIIREARMKEARGIKA